MSDVKRVVLAYSGGLDTSVIAKWLTVERGLEVVTTREPGGTEGADLRLLPEDRLVRLVLRP